MPNKTYLQKEGPSQPWPPTDTPRLYLRDWQDLGHTVSLVPRVRYPCGCGCSEERQHG